jgi:hypothetical protein
MSVCVGLIVATGSAADETTTMRFDFESGDLSGWMLLDEGAWRLGKEEGNGVLELFRPGKHKAKVRSPFGLAILREPTWSDFTLDVRLKSLARDYGHRDLCLFFGHQDSEHFYYVHFGQKGDEHSNSIFIVDDKPRRSIAKTRTAGTPWNSDWHHARVKRDVTTGSIDVYFDDMETPAMHAEDKTFLSGRVGVGSFDDAGRFDDLVIEGKLTK